MGASVIGPALSAGLDEAAPEEDSMAIKARITQDELDALPDVLKGEYVEDGDAYQLSVEEVDGVGLANAGKMNEAIRKERLETKKVRDRLKPFEGLDAESARAAIERAAELESQVGDGTNPDLEKIKAKYVETAERMKAQHAKELAEFTTKIESAQGDLERTVVQSDAVRAIAKSKGNPDLLMPHVLAVAKAIRGEDGSWVSRIMDGGIELPSNRTGSAGASMDLEEYVSGRLRERFPQAYEGTGATGGGATGSGGSSNGRFTIAASVAKSDPAAYARVRESAVAAGQQVQIVES